MLLNEKQKRILELDAKQIGVERVSVWLFDANRNSMTTEAIYSFSKNEYLPGRSLKKSDYPAYFESLKKNYIINADDAIVDARTSEFAEEYLKPLGITSMLDVPIKIDGNVVAVLCHEHIGDKRIWTKREQLYAESIADLFALAIDKKERNEIYNALFESEQRFSFALTALPVVFWTTDLNLIITSTGGEGVKQLGFVDDQSKGLSLYEYFGTTDKECLPIAAHLKSLNGESLKLEYEFLGHVFEFFVEPLRDSKGDVIGCIGMAINISDRKKSEQFLQKRKLQLSSIFDTVADSIFVLEVEENGTYRFDSVNKAFTNTTGLEASIIIGKRVHEIIPTDSLRLAMDRYEMAIRENKIVFWEETSDYPNGRLTGIVSIAPVFDNDGKCIQLVGSVKDITERKKIDDELKKSEERYQKFADLSYEGIAIHDMGLLIQVNPALAKMFGYTETEMVGMNALELGTPESAQTIIDNIKLGTEEPYEVLAIRKNGEKFSIELQGKPLLHNGKMVRVAAIRDITRRKKVENDLRKSEERFRLLVETTNVIPWESDVHTFQFTYVGPQAVKILGYPVTDWYTLDFWPNHIHEDDRKQALDFCLEAFRTRSDYEFEYRMIAENGEVVWFHDVVNVQYENDKPIVLRGYLIDITERKKIENELRKSEERFRLLAETTNIIPWEIDATTLQCTYVGPQAQAILGFPVKDWYDQDFWVNNLHPDDKERTVAYWMETFNKFGNYQFEYRMISKSGNIVWFHDVANVEFSNDKPILLRGYLIDITTRKTAEEKVQKINIELEQRVEERTSQLKSINKELEKSKIAAEESRVAKELFLASMSHEIRTPLNAIIGFQQLLKETPLNEEQHEFVESIDFAGRNLLVIINDILDLSKIEAGKFEFDEIEFNVSDIIHSVIELVEHRAKEKDLKLFFSHDALIPKKLYGDSTRLSQVLLNLIGNAVKFTDKGEVKTSVNLLSETDEFVSCEFLVEDTGIGIPEDKLAFIFERFNQENTATSRKYGGTGLGLTISRHLVEMQGGSIHVKSEKGKGSIFSFQLRFKKNPTSKSISDARKQTEDGNDIEERKLNILLAEDVVLNQKLVIKIMQKWGHHLDIAENGKVAVEKVESNDYDLILMDIQMPIMDGYHAAAMIRNLQDERKRKIPIVALTAHASHAEAEKCINLGMNAYVAKPFNQQQLHIIINQLTSGK